MAILASRETETCSRCRVLLQLITSNSHLLTLFSVALITAIDYDSAIAVLQQLHAVNRVQCSHVCCTFAVERRAETHRHRAERIGIVIGAERLGHLAGVRLIDVAQRIILIRSIIQSFVDFVVQVKVQVQVRS